MAVQGLSTEAVRLAQMRYHMAKTVMGLSFNGVMEAATASALSALGMSEIRP